ncbi:hypothetical protein EST38_g5152 [Candolleomyces aberdarensis]|uniref:C2H2-type domain-containing protein n=1 Tax=Candolleomyces aberdarensis TaxID=2316362 RepID=A0A4Q2DL64_9AGAR|nr:hypothetical protein EST38_g5152 [Candolleomyces aberdarensis]
MEQLAREEIPVADSDEDTGSNPGSTAGPSSPAPTERSAADSDEETGSASLGSTWEFSAPAPPENSRRRSSVSAYSTMTSTPAQELASRYRAGMPLEAVLASSVSSSSQPKRATVNEYNPPLHATEYKSSVVCDADLGPDCRQSRHDALLATMSEAWGYIEAQGVGMSDNIRCGRDGCNDVLRNFEALMRHLHIHNLGPSLDICPRCNELMEDQQEHVCQRRSRLHSLPSSGLASPLKETFFRVMSKMDPLFRP